MFGSLYKGVYSFSAFWLVVGDSDSSSLIVDSSFLISLSFSFDEEDVKVTFDAKGVILVGGFSNLSNKLVQVLLTLSLLSSLSSCCSLSIDSFVSSKVTFGIDSLSGVVTSV